MTIVTLAFFGFVTGRHTEDEQGFDGLQKSSFKGTVVSAEVGTFQQDADSKCIFKRTLVSSAPLPHMSHAIRKRQNKKEVRQYGSGAQRHQGCEASEIMFHVLVHVRTCLLAIFFSLCTGFEAVA